MAYKTFGLTSAGNCRSAEAAFQQGVAADVTKQRRSFWAAAKLGRSVYALELFGGGLFVAGAIEVLAELLEPESFLATSTKSPEAD